MEMGSWGEMTPGKKYLDGCIPRRGLCSPSKVLRRDEIEARTDTDARDEDAPCEAMGRRSNML